MQHIPKHSGLCEILAFGREHILSEDHKALGYKIVAANCNSCASLRLSVAHDMPELQLAQAAGVAG
jgi:hypothetical protein